MVVTCAISLWCTNREVYHLKSGTSINCRAAWPSDGRSELLVSWGKRSALLPVGLALGFGAATGEIVDPITLVAELLLKQLAPGDFCHLVVNAGY